MIAKFFDRVRERREAARLIDELTALSGPDLKDLGLTRDQVRAFTGRPARS